MVQKKEECILPDEINPAPSLSTANDDMALTPAGAPASAPSSRGRGRGRGRGRVKPRSVPRKKPPTRVVRASDSSRGGRGGRGGHGERAERTEPSSCGGRGERGGRSGRGGFGDGGRGGRSLPQYDTGVIGLGQIAPQQRLPASSAGSASRRSSGVGTQSSGGGGGGEVGSGAASRASGASFASGFGGAEAGSASGGLLSEDGQRSTIGRGELGLGDGDNARAEDGVRQWIESAGNNSDTDDELGEDDIKVKNRDIAGYVGCLADGVLLPVSTDGMRSVAFPTPCCTTLEQVARPLEPLRASVPASAPAVFVKQEAGASGTLGIVKPEPMEAFGVDHDGSGDWQVPQMPYQPTVGQPLDPMQFPAGSAARHVLLADEQPFFMQLPGLLPLEENRAAWKEELAGTMAPPRDATAPGGPAAWRKDTRDVGTDIRRVGRPDVTMNVGRMRFYKSGRVQILFKDGSHYDVAPGARCRTAQQLVSFNKEGEKGAVCDELCNAISSRLVCTPSMSSLLPSTHVLGVKKGKVKAQL